MNKPNDQNPAAGPSKDAPSYTKQDPKDAPGETVHQVTPADVIKAGKPDAANNQRKQP